jgi:hypothetical protein
MGFASLELKGCSEMPFNSVGSKGRGFGAMAGRVGVCGVACSCNRAKPLPMRTGVAMGAPPPANRPRAFHRVRSMEASLVES